MPLQPAVPMSLVQTLRCDAEPLPRWLESPPPRFDRSKFFDLRTVYYPASGYDGSPVRLCARAHSAHAFVYVDNGVSEETIREEAKTFKGYEVERLEEVSESTLTPKGWVSHYDRSKRPPDRGSIRPFALFAVLRRLEALDDKPLDDTHGPQRLAILFVGGDAFATFDALYCQNDGTRPPFLIVLQHCMELVVFDRFDRDHLLERIARHCSVFPQWLLVSPDYKAWHGFVDSGAEPDRGRGRRLFLRPHSCAWEKLRRAQADTDD